MADQPSHIGSSDGQIDQNATMDTGQNTSTGVSDPFEGESPEIKGLLEKAMELENEIQAAIATSKATITKQTEIRQPLMEIMKIIVQQQVMIGHLMGRLSSEPKERTPSYAQIVSASMVPPSNRRDRSRSKVKKSHNIMVYPKTEGVTSDQTRKRIQSKITPSSINVKTNSVRNIGKGGIIINAPSSDDIDKLLVELQQMEEIKDEFQAFKPKLKDPSIIIYNVTEDLSNEDFLESLKSQNIELSEATLTVRTSFRSRCGKYGHIALKCRDENFREGGGLCLRCGTKGHRERECSSDPKCINFINSFFCAHLNLNHTRRANIQLSQDIINFNYDIVSFNDPYVYENKVTEFPDKFHKYAHNYKPLAGFIVSNSKFRSLALLTERTLVVIEVDTGNEIFILCSICCTPSSNFDEDLASLQSVILNNVHKKIIIFGDFNAKSPIWGKRGSDIRGQKLSDFINNNDLFVINRSDSLPTFSGPQGESWIDLALSLNIHPDGLQNWNITDRLTLSDHFIMELTVVMDPNPNKRKNKKWKLSELNFWRFKELLNIFVNKGFEVGDDIDSLIEHIQQGLVDICFRSRKIRNFKRQNSVWWNQELESMRSLVRALRRRYQKIYETTERVRRQIIFKKHLAIYVSKIALAKENSFRTFLGSIVKVNTFDSFYKLVKKNYNLTGGVQCVMRDTGVLTSSLKESMEVILEHFFPRLETNLNQNQIRFRDNYFGFPEIKEVEISRIFASCANDKAPGPDGLSLGIIREFYDSNKNLFINIMNTLMGYGYFPTI
ncbi:hypothetical protein AVEN_174879-1 [Araneus ventricosus]|uniref:CCHC-type domain-containing protein n=1 Tax=Araneus ventricosus TaxID=182803 RepID=A0A4Y2TS07_ARAVE|nr:hypothetical protein AVEN_76793-1 [Araneus ventricosus]GBO02454.1 hypothetical protein AVEN_174879-1 [Araneus ventricosus]